MYLNIIQSPNILISGTGGISATCQAGIDIKPSNAFRLLMRLSKIFDPEKVLDIMLKKVTEYVPVNAKVIYLNSNSGS